MEIFDVAIVGGGPAGSTCAAFCARAGLRTLLLERENFPREKVCGDCLNPSCWPVLNRLDLGRRLRALPHAKLDWVEFIAISGQKVIIDLPSGDEGELVVKRSLFDDLLLTRARELGADVYEETTVTSIAQIAADSLGGRASSPPRPASCRTISEFRGRDAANGGQDARTPGSLIWKIDTGVQSFSAQILVGADGRNSTVARLCNLLPRPARERIALQSHLPLPENFGNGAALQFLSNGYAGLAPVNDRELNVCLVGKPREIDTLKAWATGRFGISPNHPWRTITPLTRAPIPPQRENLLFIGDSARVVEPFTGEGIYYGMRSGELAAESIAKMIRGENRESTLHEFARVSAEMYRGRLWINEFARAAVLSPRLGSFLVHAARLHPSILKLLTAKIVTPN